MKSVGQAINDLVIANRVLAHEGVVDGYGHVSFRHPRDPSRFLLSRSRSPELVTPEDIMEFTIDGLPVGNDRRPPYLERFIHSAVYEARHDVNAVVHSHAESVLPFSITQTPLIPVTHSAAAFGCAIPVWDIADRFGDTNLLVTNEDQGRDLAQTLGNASAALMRGHGFVAAAGTLLQVLQMSVALPKNARVYMEALRLDGPVKALSEAEIALRQQQMREESPATLRAWEYWAKRCGCGHLLGDHFDEAHSPL